MKIIFALVFLCNFFSTSSFANEVILSSAYSWSRTNISGQNNLPLYTGNGISGKIEYLIPFGDTNSISFYASLLKTKESNSANSSINETLKLSFLGGGLKYTFNNFYTSFSVGKLSFEDTVSGTISKTITAESLGYDLGLGVRLRMTRLIGFTIGIGALHSSLNPTDGSGFYSNYGLWQFRGSVGLTFILPSLPFGEFSVE